MKPRSHLERETLSVGVALAALSTTSLMYATCVNVVSSLLGLTCFGNVNMVIIVKVNMMNITFSSMSRIESGKQLLPVGVATRELRREFASSIT